MFNGARKIAWDISCSPIQEDKLLSIDFQGLEYPTQNRNNC